MGGIPPAWLSAANPRRFAGNLAFPPQEATGESPGPQGPGNPHALNPQFPRTDLRNRPAFHPTKGRAYVGSCRQGGMIANRRSESQASIAPLSSAKRTNVVRASVGVCKCHAEGERLPE